MFRLHKAAIRRPHVSESVKTKLYCCCRTYNYTIRNYTYCNSCRIFFLYRMGHGNVAHFPFARVLVIFSLALVCILRGVFEQLVKSRAVTMLRYTRCNIVILMAATACVMLSFSSCIVCGLDSYTVAFKCPQRKFLPPPPHVEGGGEKFSVRTLEKYGIRIKSAHYTGTEAHHTRSCIHKNH